MSLDVAFCGRDRIRIQKRGLVHQSQPCRSCFSASRGNRGPLKHAVTSLKEEYCEKDKLVRENKSVLDV